MAKAPSDPRTISLNEQMEDTRSAIQSVVDALRARDVTSRQIALAATWNPGYLSEVLANPAKTPGVPKTEALIRALVMFAREKGAIPEADAELRRVAARYGVPLEPLANPTAGPISASAENYVLCADVAQALAVRLRYPGFYAIDGTAMSGVSTALAFVGKLLQDRGARVARVDAKTDLGEERLGKSKARILGALASAIVGTTDLLDEEYYAVQDAIRAYLIASTPEIGIIIDNVNHIAHDQQLALGRVLREWQTRRASAELGFTSTTVWLGYTWRFDSVTDVAAHSHMALDYVFLRPFTAEETTMLARALEPYGRAGGRVEDGWAEAAATAAFAYFNGQPHLTHLYLWDRLEDGRGPAEETVSGGSRPSGAYDSHLRQLARAAVGLLGEGGAEDLADSLRACASVEAAGPRKALEDIGIVDAAGRSTNRYYSAHLPEVIAQALASTSLPSWK
jgi:hypothetical protein